MKTTVVLLKSLFSEQVKKFANNLALISGDQLLNYQQLDQCANRLANYIHQKINDGNYGSKDILIAFCLPQGIDAIVTLLAIIKCGAAYLPLDSNNPAERLKYILQDSQSVLLITKESIVKQIPEIGILYQDRLVLLDDENEESNIANQTIFEPTTSIEENSLAYVIYTSGSSGKPKGVMIEQHSIVNLVCETNYIKISSNDKVVAFSNLSFDAATFEIWGALLNGAALVCPPADVLQSVDHFRRFLALTSPTIAFLTTALFQALAAQDATVFGGFKYLLMGGDVINPKLVRSVLSDIKNKPIHLLHAYGPTETTVFATMYEITAIAQDTLTVPIGNFVKGCEGYVLDKQLQPCDINVTGELYLGGKGLARGYLNNQSEQNSAAFTVINGKRLYRTGDLVRYIDSLTLEFVGRDDFQVKIRGFRVELNEVEAVLSRHPNIEQVCVIVQGKNSESKHLVAFCVMSKAVDEFCQDKLITFWENIYENLYQLEDSQSYLDDFSGWESTFTQSQIPFDEMKEWQQATVERIKALHPAHVFEIGCGSGLLLFPLIQQCKHYIGIDISQNIIARLKLALAKKNINNTTIAHGYAHRLDQISTLTTYKQIDTVIINSVTLHFPNEDYLLSVITQCIAKLKRGYIFIGDVRDYRLINTFNLAVVRYQNPDLNWTQCQEIAKYRCANEQDLLTSPEFFLNLTSTHNAITYLEILPKRGHSLHEMNCFRFDVIIHVSQESKQATAVDWQTWSSEINLGSIIQKCSTSPQGISHYPNKRVWLDFHRQQLLQGSLDVDHEIMEYCKVNEKILILEELYALAEEHRVRLSVYLSIGEVTSPACFNLVFIKNDSNFIPGDFGYTKHSKCNFTNQPILRDTNFSFESIRQYVEKQLPAYMQPAEYIQLDQLPLTSNGKIDKKKLRSIKHERNSKSHARCIDNIHYQVLLLWETIFKQSPIAADANFIGLGGNSILAIELVNLLNKKFTLKLSVAWIFKHQTIHEQADNIRQSQNLNRYQPIITFNANGETPPFYIIHPGLIGAECYAELANLLDRNVTFFGVDSYNLYNEPMKMTINDLAQYYAAQIAARENKTLYLGGWSLGGLVAYEVACLLHQQGITTLKLFLIEPDPPNHHYEVISGEQNVDIKKLNDTPGYILTYLKKLPSELIDKVLNNLSHDLRLSTKFKPEFCFAGKTIIFEAEHWTGGSFMGDQVNLSQSWAPYMANMQAFKLPGDHFSLMDGANIEFIANIINSEIMTHEALYE